MVGSRVVAVAAALVHPRRRRPLPDPCRTHRRTRPGRADSYQVAKRMIVDGGIPTPEEAQPQLECVDDKTSGGEFQEIMRETTETA